MQVGSFKANTPTLPGSINRRKAEENRYSRLSLPCQVGFPPEEEILGFEQKSSVLFYLEIQGN